jgi:hypothetical protein
MVKHRNRIRLNNHALRSRLKYVTAHAPVKSIGFTMLASVATGIAIGILIKK